MRAVAGFALLVLLAACTAVGPDYDGPPVSTADEAGIWPSAGDAAGLVKASEPPADWWRQLDDPLLNELIGEAIGANYDLRIAIANIRGARAGLLEVETRRRPSIDLSGRVQERRDSSALFVIADADDRLPTTSNASFSLDMAWELDLFGRIRRSIEAASADLGSLEAVRNAVITSVIGEVAQAYLELRGAQIRIDVARRNVTVQQQTLDLVNLLQHEGAATELDVARARTQLLTSESRIPGLKAAVRAALNRLSALTAKAPGGLVERMGHGELPPLPEFVAAGNPIDLLRRRADLAAAERRLAAAVARIGVSTADLYPTVRFGGTVGAGGAPVSSLDSAGAPFFAVGPSLQWNLFDRRAIHARIARQDARSEVAMANFESTVTTALEEVDTALNAWVNERGRRDLLGEARAASLQASELAQLRYREGVEDFLTVLDAQRNLLIIEDQLATSQTLLALRLVQIYRALGGGWQTVAGTGSP